MSETNKFYQYDRNDNNTFGVRGTASGGTEVVANPELAGTESALTGLQIGETKYKIDQPINVEANPTLAGTESALTGLEVGTTKYKVEAGMTNPMTTKGDIIYGGTSGNPTRLAPSSAYHDYLKYDALQNTPVWTQIGKDDIYANSGNQYKVMYVSSNQAGFVFNYGKPAQDFGLGYTTTAPVADNTDGLKFVVLTSEPATYYNGYYYIIAPST